MIVVVDNREASRFEGWSGDTLADVRERGQLRVVPRCPFIRGWIERHPAYADLVDGGVPDAGRE